MSVCKDCHHEPSDRDTEGLGRCYCGCHDVADASPEMLQALESFIRRPFDPAASHALVKKALQKAGRGHPQTGGQDHMERTVARRLPDSLSDAILAVILQFKAEPEVYEGRASERNITVEQLLAAALAGMVARHFGACQSAQQFS